MGTETSTSYYSNRRTWRTWSITIGIIVALVGLFWQPVWLGVIGAFLSLIGLAGAKTPSHKAWGWIGLVLGIVIWLLGIYGWTFAGHY